MKKESVRKQEAREQMKKRAGQVAATIGVAGAGTAFAATAFAGADDAMQAAEPVEETVEVDEAEATVSPVKPSNHSAHAHQSQSASQTASAATSAFASAPQEETVEEEHVPEDVEEIGTEGEIDVDGDSIVIENEESAEPVSPAFTPMNAVSGGVYEVESIEMDNVDLMAVTSDEDFNIDGLADLSVEELLFPEASISFDDMMSGDDCAEGLENDLDF